MKSADDQDIPLVGSNTKLPESLARKRGYEGTWPPRWPTVTNREQFDTVLSRLEGGEHRAAYVYTLGRRLVTLYAELTPEHFRRLALVVKRVILDRRTAPRVRLRGIQVILRPLRDAVLLLAEQRNERRHVMADHLERCLGAFYTELADDDLRDFVAVLDDVAQRSSSGTQIRAVQTLLRLVLDGMTLMARLENLIAAEALPTEEDRAIEEQANAELDAMLVEADDEEAQRVAGDTRLVYPAIRASYGIPPAEPG